MAEGDPEVTLNTLHGDLTEVRGAITDVKGEIADLRGEMRAGFADVKGEMRTGFADLKATMISGFARMFTREQGDEMIRVLRESHRIQEARLTQVDTRVAQVAGGAELDRQKREADIKLQVSLDRLSEENRGLSSDIRALIRRIDALIRRRDNGGEPPDAPRP
ncbi:MAG: hypothetical protein FJZ38_19410 [Candidatus Rokubacteria bacterium]|nr:hypothetical protein [Candidatus Rokubacteria bacterium]